MNRTQTFTLALMGIATLAPLSALAQDASASVSAPTPVQVRPQLGVEGGFNAGASTTGTREFRGNASTTEMRQQHEASSSAARGDKVMGAANNGIDARITAMQKLQNRISGLSHISNDQKASLTASLSAQITSLTALKAKIGSDTGVKNITADAKTIAPDYRIYMLVMPQADIAVASDRVLGIASEMTTVGAKLQTRISEASATGANVTSAQSAYADYQSKVADASVQANAAINSTKSLTVDNGNSATLTANTAALKAARAKLKTAETDLKAARADMNVMMKAVKGKGSGAEVHASSSAEVR